MSGLWRAVCSLRRKWEWKSDELKRTVATSEDGGAEEPLKHFNLKTSTTSLLTPPQTVSKLSPTLADSDKLKMLRQDLPRLVWQSAGICRDGTTMAAAIAQVEYWQEEFANLAVSRSLLHRQPGKVVALETIAADAELRVWAETRNLLDVAWLILKSAHFRTESRGGHYRTDYPDVAEAWAVHTIAQQQHKGAFNNTCWSKAPLLTRDNKKIKLAVHPLDQ
jgi:aspartate oxidase